MLEYMPTRAASKAVVRVWRPTLEGIGVRLYPRPMTDNSESLQRLAGHIERRITELGLEYAEVARLADFSIEVLRKMRHGIKARGSTYRKLERALQWAQGSVAAILAGGEPMPVGVDDTPFGEQPDPELELAQRLLASTVREMGLTTDEADEAWRRARAEIVRSRASESDDPPRGRRRRAG